MRKQTSMIDVIIFKCNCLINMEHLLKNVYVCGGGGGSNVMTWKKLAVNLIEIPDGRHMRKQQQKSCQCDRKPVIFV